MSEPSYPMLPGDVDIRQYRRLMRLHQDFMRAVFDALQLGKINDQSFIIWEFLGRVPSPTAEQIAVMNFILQHYHFHWRIRADRQPERALNVYHRLKKSGRLWGFNEAETWRILNAWNTLNDDAEDPELDDSIDTVLRPSR